MEAPVAQKCSLAQIAGLFTLLNGGEQLGTQMGVLLRM